MTHQERKRTRGVDPSDSKTEEGIFDFVVVYGNDDDEGYSGCERCYSDIIGALVPPVRYETEPDDTNQSHHIDRDGLEDTFLRQQLGCTFVTNHKLQFETGVAKLPDESGDKVLNGLRAGR